MITIEVKDNCQQVRDSLGRIRTNLSKFNATIPKKVASMYAREIRSEAKIAFSIPTGTTGRSIRTIKTSEGYGVSANKHAWATDKGRGPSKGYGKFDFESLDTWAAKAGYNKYALVKSIRRYGTHARPFITTGIQRGNQILSGKVEEEASKIIKG